MPAKAPEGAGEKWLTNYKGRIRKKVASAQAASKLKEAGAPETAAAIPKEELPQDARPAQRQKDYLAKLARREAEGPVAGHARQAAHKTKQAAHLAREQQQKKSKELNARGAKAAKASSAAAAGKASPKAARAKAASGTTKQPKAHEAKATKASSDAPAGNASPKAAKAKAASDTTAAQASSDASSAQQPSSTLRAKAASDTTASSGGTAAQASSSDAPSAKVPSDTHLAAEPSSLSFTPAERASESAPSSNSDWRFQQKQWQASQAVKAVPASVGIDFLQAPKSPPPPPPQQNRKPGFQARGPGRPQGAYPPIAPRPPQAQGEEVEPELTAEERKQEEEAIESVVRCVGTRLSQFDLLELQDHSRRCKPNVRLAVTCCDALLLTLWLLQLSRQVSVHE